MIRVLIPDNYEFNYKQCKKLFKKHKKLINENQDFRNIVKNTFFYSFFDDEKFLGCIYYYYKNNRLYFNGFSDRHTHLQNLECLKMSFDWFNCDIYAETPHKTAILCLLKCGFKKISENTYKLAR